MWRLTFTGATNKISNIYPSKYWPGKYRPGRFQDLQRRVLRSLPGAEFLKCPARVLLYGYILHTDCSTDAESQ